jgi:hypothetical protein
MPRSQAVPARIKIRSAERAPSSLSTLRLTFPQSTALNCYSNSAAAGPGLVYSLKQPHRNRLKFDILRLKPLGLVHSLDSAHYARKYK